MKVATCDTIEGMRYQVPQFVDIEDKIIGPFTLRQFLMYVVAVMVLVPVYLNSDLSLFITVALPVLGTAAAFAHVKIAHKSLGATITNAAKFATGGQLFLWRRGGKTRPLIIKDENWKEANAALADARSTPLLHLAQTIETKGNLVKAEEVPDEFSPEQ